LGAPETLLDPQTLMLAAALGLAALVLGAIAAVMLARAAEDRDIAGRLRGAVRPADRGMQPSATANAAVGLLVAPFQRLGESLRASSFMSEKDISELERAVAALGIDPRRAVPTFVGVKAVSLVVVPLGAYLYASQSGYSLRMVALISAIGLILGIFGPNWAVGYLRRPFQKKLRRGLPDALDLMVVCAEAGLGMETAIERVAREMQPTNAPIALEFTILLNELRMLPDRRQALQRFGDRSDIEGFKRLGSTLAQTMRYGTPLSQALRVLASEMRQERMLKMEEKAVRLPALLVLPLILFIMPSLFIALVGPSILSIMNALGNMSR
jgi:tight adherence protein C